VEISVIGPEHIVAHTSFKEVKDHWLQLVSGTTMARAERTRRLVRKWQAGSDRRFIGATISEMRDWLENGYQVPGLEADVGFKLRPSRKLAFKDEGELQVDLVLGAYEYPFLEWDPRPRKPGLILQVDWDFSAMTKSNVIADYARWLAQLIQRLETDGYDLAVTLVCQAREIVRGRYHDLTEVHMTVKRENESVDFSTWSAVFSPGGFRMLGFMSVCMAAEAQGGEPSDGLGTPVSKGWGLSFDDEERKLHVHCSSAPTHFPADGMTYELEQLSESIPIL